MRSPYAYYYYYYYYYYNFAVAVVVVVAAADIVSIFVVAAVAAAVVMGCLPERDTLGSAADRVEDSFVSGFVVVATVAVAGIEMACVEVVMIEKAIVVVVTQMEKENWVMMTRMTVGRMKMRMPYI